MAMAGIIAETLAAERERSEKALAAERERNERALARAERNGWIQLGVLVVAMGGMVFAAVRAMVAVAQAVHP